MSEKNYIFVVELDSGDIIAARKDEIIAEVKRFEKMDEELNFKTIGRIFEPPQGLTPDINSMNIEWYEKDRVIDKQLIDNAVIAIVNLLLNIR